MRDRAGPGVALLGSPVPIAIVTPLREECFPERVWGPEPCGSEGLQGGRYWREREVLGVEQQGPRTRDQA